MSTIRIQHNNKTKEYKVAGSWEALSAFQRHAVFKLFYTKLTQHELWVEVFKVVMGLKTSAIKKWFKVLDEDQVYDCIRVLDFIFRDKSKLLQNPYPTLGNLVGPADELKNVCAAEYMDAYYAMQAYFATKDENQLNKLVGILWRPKRPGFNRENPKHNNDERTIYNAELIDNHLKEISKFPINEKFACCFYVISCHNHIAEHPNFKTLFSNDTSGGTTETLYGMYDTLFTMADKGIFGDYEKTGLTNIYTFFAGLSKNAHDQQNAPTQ